MVSASSGRHPWRFIAIVAGSMVGGSLALAAVVPFRSETARKKVIEILSQRLHAEVELEDLRIRLWPWFRAEGHGLTVRYHGRRDVPPLLSVKTIAAEATLLTILRRHFTRVELEPLEIVIPPDRNRDAKKGAGVDTPTPGRRNNTSNGGKEPGSQAAADMDHSSGPDGRMLRTFFIDELVAHESRVIVMPNDHADDPVAASKDEKKGSPRRDRVWEIRHLRMQSVSVDGAAPFVATVENAIPPGNIETAGSFGPWQPDEPWATPLDGRFTFDHADLGVFKGISGILSAHGTFSGTLDRIDVNGETDTPDFTVDIGKHPVALHTVYHAVVDGSDGNTLLENIDASFLSTSLNAKGGVLGTPGVSGRTIKLEVMMNGGRLEDVLQLAVKGQPPISGALTLSTTLLIPPDDRNVVDKLRLEGWFTIGDARFTLPETQKKIHDLSHRTRGRDTNEHVERVSSQFAGSFTLGDGRLSVPHVTFDVPGAAIRLAGTYGLTSERLDFHGTAFTDARISEMTRGFKSLLLKPLDLIFKRNGGGAEIPIRIGGTRHQPSFGLDKGRVFTGAGATPGASDRGPLRL